MIETFLTCVLLYVVLKIVLTCLWDVLCFVVKLPATIGHQLGMWLYHRK